MKRFLSTAILASTLLLSQVPSTNAEYKGKNKYGVDIFTLNLDLPEEQRFVEVSAHYKDFVVEVLNQYISIVPQPVLYLLQKLGGAIYYIQPEYYMEI